MSVRARSWPTPRDPLDCAHQAPLSMGFSRQDYWSGLPCPPPGDLPDPGTEPASLVSPALTGGSVTTSGKPPQGSKWTPMAPPPNCQSEAEAPTPGPTGS